MTAIRVRGLGPDDWELTRSVRLAALADAPEAFATTTAATAARGEADWRALLSDPTYGVRALAQVDGAPAGLIGVYPESGTGELIWVWADPAYRGLGVGEALLGFAADWCAWQGLDCALWVFARNTPARRLYERVGFVATGQTQTLPGEPDRVEIRMVRPNAGVS